MDGRGADADAPDLTVEIAHLDRVAHLDRALQEQDDARYEVVDDGLEAEAYADAESAREEGDAVEVHTHRPDSDHEAQEKGHVVQKARDRVRQAAPHGKARVDILLQGEADEARDKKGRPDGHRQRQDITQRDAHESAGKLIVEHAQPEALDLV